MYQPNLDPRRLPSSISENLEAIARELDALRRERRAAASTSPLTGGVATPWHNTLPGRDSALAHPISAIDGFTEATEALIDARTLYNSAVRYSFNLPASDPVGAARLVLDTGELWVKGESGWKTSAPLRSAYAGVSSTPGPEWTQTAPGSFRIEGCLCNLYPNADYTGGLSEFSIIPAEFTLTDDVEQDVVVDYNGGNPIYVLADKGDWNMANRVIVYRFWREVDEIHSVSMDSLGVALPEKHANRANKTNYYARAFGTGLKLSTDSSRHVLITGAQVFAGLVEVSVLSFDSTTDDMDKTYWIGDDWAYLDEPVLDNTNYQGPTGLVPLSPNRFAVRWIYRSIGDVKQVFYQLGTQQHTNIDLALKEAPPTQLAEVIQGHCMRVGRIIVQQGTSAPVHVDSEFDSQYSGAGVVEHNNLSAIDGGGGGRYFHFSEADYLARVVQTRYDQTSAALTWGPFVNPFARPCDVTIIDSTGNEFEGDIVHAVDYSTVTVVLKNAMSGTIILQ